MIIGVVSDSHGDIESLKAMLRYPRQHRQRCGFMQETMPPMQMHWKS